MPYTTDLKLIGGGDLVRQLGKLANGTATKVLRKGLRAASKPITAAMKAEAPVGETQAIKQSIGPKRVKAKKRGQVGLTVAPQAKPLAKKSGKKKYYAGPVNHGHVMRNGKFVAPDDFVKRGFNRAEAKALTAAKNTIFDELDKVS
jgi:hypothetical protein